MSTIKNKWALTLSLVVIAAAAIAVTAGTRPRAVGRSAESELGQPLTPLLIDPLAVRSLEVIGFDEQSARARGFKVAFDASRKRWVIPSAFDYPVEATQTMATAAAGFVNLLKERVATDNTQEHQRLGVVDPSDEASTATTGRGSRVTLRDASGKVLADLILGKGVDEGTPGAITRKYVREAGRSRVYVTSAQMALSTRLVDWLNADLVSVPSDEVRGVEVVRYRIDESTGKVTNFSRLALARGEPGAVATSPESPSPVFKMPGQPPVPTAPTWTIESEPEGSLGAGQSVDATKVEAALGALREIEVIGVQPKPANLAKLLAGGGGEGRMTIVDQANLQSRGFFLTPQGSMMANEGQINITTRDGVIYTLWLGELAIDEVAKEQAGGASAVASPAATSNASDATQTAGEGSAGPGRYVMLTVSVDEAVIGPAPTKPEELLRLEGLDAAAAKEDGTPVSDGDKAALASARQAYLPLAEAHAQRLRSAREKAAQLSARFADWYYVASAKDLDQLRPTREQLIAAPLSPNDAPVEQESAPVPPLTPLSPSVPSAPTP